ncbi:Lamin-like protein [Sesamum alatum]|uniref:Lamin-like protein n=1 Tax=Sesamum alatum TaxID=300844 RepID=A0AAE1XU36_9LAMI|nr:Lamin-like protein [Sesamum alatum]
MGWLPVVLAAAMLTCAVGELIKVGGRAGWAENVNYTEWAAARHFYVGDWLYFVFDKRYYTVLEVKRSNYEQCNDSEFIKNISRGGRDVFNLTEARAYYFLTSGGYCYHGMKLAIHVQELVPPSPPPHPSPSTSAASSAGINHKYQIVFFSFLFVVIACYRL